MMTNFQKVRDFNISFGIGRSDNPDAKLKKLRYDLIREEVDELQQAIKIIDYKEIIDAVSDILYVIHGAADSYGQDLDKYIDWYVIHDEHNTIRNILNFSGKQINSLSDQMTLVFERYNELLNYFMIKLENTMVKLTNMLFISNSSMHDNMIELAVLHNMVYQLASLFGFDLDETFDMVHQSNMSKLAETEEIAKETVKWYLENEKRYDSPAYRLSPVKVNNQPRWVIYNESTGKALKSIHYFPVNFGPLFTN
jgi:hypothetical protein